MWIGTKADLATSLPSLGRPHSDANEGGRLEGDVTYVRREHHISAARHQGCHSPRPVPAEGIRIRLPGQLAGPVGFYCALCGPG